MMLSEYESLNAEQLMQMNSRLQQILGATEAKEAAEQALALKKAQEEKLAAAKAAADAEAVEGKTPDSAPPPSALPPMDV
jgi:hypothetical protein